MSIVISILISFGLAGAFLEHSRRAVYRYRRLRHDHVEWLALALEWQLNPELVPEVRLASLQITAVRAEMAKTAHQAALWCAVWALISRKRRRPIAMRA